MYRQIFLGSMIHANDNREVIFKDNVGIFVEDGKIIDITENPDQAMQMMINFNANEDEINILSPGQFMIPGFIDCRIHATQFLNSGLGCGKTSLDYLEDHTFPMEKNIDAQYAQKIFETVVRRTIQNGTTTACYFTSLDTVISTCLAGVVSDSYQRAFVGKINMNVPRFDGYYEDTKKSIWYTESFIKDVENLEMLASFSARISSTEPLVKPIIMPRFAMSCDMELMQELAKIAKEKDLLIQSTISESKVEAYAVRGRFQKATYTDVYDSAGLLTNKTILAHGVYLEDSELNMLANRGTAIIHCPTSNLNLKSGLCDVRRLMAHNIDVGLGADISVGPSYGILNEMKEALHISNILSLMGHDYVPLNYKDVFFMATLGGAKALSIEDKVGNFMPNKEFDALIIDLDAKNSFIDNFREYTLDEKLQKFIYSGTSHNIVSVYVRAIEFLLLTK